MRTRPKNRPRRAADCSLLENLRPVSQTERLSFVCLMERAPLWRFRFHDLMLWAINRQTRSYGEESSKFRFADHSDTIPR
jgi:hypothetical protein